MHNLTRVNEVNSQDGAFLAVGARGFNDCIKDLNELLQQFSYTRKDFEIGKIPLNEDKANLAPILFKGRSIGNVRILKSKKEEKRRSSRRKTDRGVDYAVGATTWIEFLLMGYFNILKTTVKSAKINSDNMRDAFVEFAKKHI